MLNGQKLQGEFRNAEAVGGQRADPWTRAMSVHS